jgi:hypothetical protein
MALSTLPTMVRISWTPIMMARTIRTSCGPEECGVSLGNGHMVLRLTSKAAALVGETPAEWPLLEKQIRAGRWTSGPRSDELKLRALAAELGAALLEEGVVPWRRRHKPRPPHAPNSAVKE